MEHFLEAGLDEFRVYSNQAPLHIPWTFSTLA